MLKKGQGVSGYLKLPSGDWQNVLYLSIEVNN